MAPIAKENEALTPAADAARRSAPAAEAGAKTQAVALELPVSVNGVRTAEGSDKREPFSEATKTVLIFGNGAVIRLQAPVAPGQLLFLTNEKTRKEVVCQVVKSKNYRNVSGYVELEFTELVVGFWGMRFPSDRIGPQAPAAGPAATPQPPAAPLALRAPGAPTPKPDAASNFNALKALASSPAVSEAPAESIKSVPTATVPPPATQPIAPATSDASSEALKQQTARLQEQLSSMLFTGKPEANTKPEAPSGEGQAPTPMDVEQQLSPAAPVKPAQTLINSAKSQLEAEEVKIPSWIEPLARNAAAASSTEPQAAKEEHPFKELPIFSSSVVAESLADSAPPAAEGDTQPFSPVFLVEDEPLTAEPARGSNKGVLFGAIAAGFLVAAAGLAWYVRNQGGSPQVVAASAATSPAAVVQTHTPDPTTAPANPPVPASSTGSPATAKPAPNPNDGAAAARVTLNNAVAKAPQPTPAPAPVQVQIQTPPKKPTLGDVRLAAPKVNGARGKSVSADEPGITLNGSEAAPSASLGEFASAKQPVAPAEPLPVGGDVKPAKLLSSVSPVYPQLAKSQHVAGDVKVDALIDASGRVTTMKVVSGPALLHQAAMDALRQWKYQPATLDGNPVSMHLTVTIQFRMQ